MLLITNRIMFSGLFWHLLPHSTVYHVHHLQVGTFFCNCIYLKFIHKKTFWKNTILAIGEFWIMRVQVTFSLYLIHLCFSSIMRICKIRRHQEQGSFPFKCLQDNLRTPLTVCPSACPLQLCWHPTKEGCLAFGTDDGKVGLYDTYSSK